MTEKRDEAVEAACIAMQSTDIAVPWDSDDRWTNHERREARESMRRALEAAKPYLIATWCLAKADAAEEESNLFPNGSPAFWKRLNFADGLRIAAAELTQAADNTERKIRS